MLPLSYYKNRGGDKHLNYILILSKQGRKTILWIKKRPKAVFIAPKGIGVKIAF